MISVSLKILAKLVYKTYVLKNDMYMIAMMYRIQLALIGTSNRPGQ